MAPSSAPARPDRLSGRAARPSAGASPEPPAWWTALSPLARHGVALAFLFAVGLAVSAPVLFGAGSLIGHDAVEWRSMAASMLGHHAATGEEPLWATNPFGGMPGVMVTHVASIPGLDTVFSTLRRVMWPLSHMAALLGGLYGLVFALTRRRGAAVVAALVFGLTTYLPVILGAGHNSKYIALCYTPALFWAFLEAVRRPRLVAALLFAMVLGLNIRAGHPQITYYAAWALALWWIAEGVGAVRSQQGSRFARATAFLALGSLLALGMAAHPLVQQAEYKAFTIRGAESASPTGTDDAFAYAMAWSQGRAELLTLVVANAFGGGGQTYFGPKSFTSGPHYVGGIAVLLALVGLAFGRRRVAWSLGGALALMLVFSLGENARTISRLAYDLVPLFDSFRVPETWLSVAALLIAVLAGLGLAAVLRAGGDGDRARRVAVLVGAGLVAAVALLYVAKGSRAYERPDERAQVAAQIAQQNGVEASDPRVAQSVDGYLAEVRPQREAAYGGDLVRTLLVLGLATLLLWLLRRGTLPPWALGPALALVVAVDLGTVWQRYLSAASLTATSATGQPVRGPEDLIERTASDGFVVAQVATAGGPGRFRTLDLSGRGLGTARAAAFYETLGGYHGAKLRLYQDYLDHILPTPQGGLNPNALPLLGVRYIAAAGPVVPGMTPVFVDSAAQMAVFETPAQGAPAPSTAADSARAAASDSLGGAPAARTDRAWFASAVETLPDDPAVWARLQDASLDVHRTALVAAPTVATTTPIGPASTATAALVGYGPREIAYDVETDAPRLFVLSEVYYPAGWTARVASDSTAEGTETPILRVDHLLRGVQVPAGRHRVTLRFDPASYRTGLTVAGVSSALVYGGLLLLVGLGFVRRRKGEDAGPDADGDDAPPIDDGVPVSPGVRG